MNKINFFTKIKNILKNKIIKLKYKNKLLISFIYHYFIKNSTINSG